jgi:hypothetical protein
VVAVAVVAGVVAMAVAVAVEATVAAVGTAADGAANNLTQKRGRWVANAFCCTDISREIFDFATAMMPVSSEVSLQASQT